MKRSNKLLCAATLLGATVSAFVACSDLWESPYASMDEAGYTVSVRYDANGGVFAGTNDVYVVDVFNLNSEKTNAAGKKEIALLEPDNALRKNNAFEVSRPDYFLAGWYQNRSLRVDENGNALDDYGKLCSESGKPQGYVYSDRWDFDHDRMEIDPNGSYTSATNTMTLYAAWIPYYTYEFYTVDGNGNVSATPYKTVQMLDLIIPQWNESTGKLDMKSFPKASGEVTLDKVYADAALTQEITDRIGGEIDYEKGIASVDTIKIYTTWREGEWFKIYNAKQFYDNSRVNGCYEIMADLDFSNQSWSRTLASGEFRGQIIGNGHKISGVTVTQTDTRQTFGGLFGSIAATAQIHNLTFENITYKLDAGTIQNNDPAFGLLAGAILDGATLDGVTVSGTLQINADCVPNAKYQIGLLCGAGTYAGIDVAGITCEAVNNGEGKLTVTVNSDHTVMLTFNN